MALPGPNIRNDIPADYITELARVLEKWQNFITPVFSIGGSVVVLGDDGQPIKTEPDGLLITIAYPHHEIHDGHMFEVSYATVAETDGNLADNAFIDFLITTPNTAGEWHCVYEASLGGDFEVNFYEDATYTGGTGTAMTAYNRNRQSANVPTLTVLRNPTVVLTGTLIENRFFAGGSGGNAVGTVGGGRDEWILDTNKQYLLRAINRAGNAQPGSLRIMWYEE